jgi:cell division protein FtsA
VESLLSSGIVLTGGTASLDGIVGLAERVFHLPVRIGAPSQTGGGLADIVSGPAYSTGVGLLLGAHAPAQELVAAAAAGAASQGVLSKVKHRMGDWLREFF